jgi:hypothetical protein
MFRLPSSVDPKTIRGAYVELSAFHDLSAHYHVDPLFTVDLLDNSVKAAWGTQDYATIHKANALAVTRPATTVRSGADDRLDFTFSCNQLNALKTSLSTLVGGKRLAPFRWESTHPNETALVSTDIGFGRRSQRVDARPKLVLITSAASRVPPLTTCNPATPAPSISNVRIDNSYTGDGGVNTFDTHSMTVSWNTNIDSDSVVLFRRKGTTSWTQVATPGLTRTHQVQILGIDTTQHYEFGVRSAGCNHKATTDDNHGAGYDLWRPAPPPPPDPGTPTAVASYNFDSAPQGWNVSGDAGTVGSWQRSSGGSGGTSAAWHFEPYGDSANQSVTSPAVTIAGNWAGVHFDARYNLEPPEYPGGVSTSIDSVRLEYSTNGGNTWVQAPNALFGGMNTSYPSYDTYNAVFLNPKPGGKLLVRFRLLSDTNVSSPPFVGASFDQVTIQSYNGAKPAPVDPFITALGPVPPKSANASGLNLASVATRTVGNAQDIAAGTAVCAG